LYRHVTYIRRLWPVILILVVFGLVLMRALDWWRLSERVAIERQLQDLETVARVRLAEAIMRGDSRQALALDGGNPFVWAQTINGAHYAGLLADTAWDKVSPGTWTFDAARGELVYRLIHPDLVIKAYPPPDQLRWRVKVMSIEERLTARQIRRRPVNVRIEPAVQFRWRE
jgi:hypothetical protein